VASVASCSRDGSRITTTHVVRQYDALGPELEVLWGTPAAAQFASLAAVSSASRTRVHGGSTNSAPTQVLSRR
jgi:hypothetical protein